MAMDEPSPEWPSRTPAFGTIPAMPPPKTLACVTMAYNEQDMLPIWLRHYARQAGARACYVLDHGSTDGSTDNIGGATLLRLERSPLDEPGRAAFVGRICAGLLGQYDYVLYADADEMLVADPARWPSLLDYINAPRAAVTTAFGMNLLHRVHHEAACDFAQPIMAQRGFASPVAALCKPSLIRRPVRWSPGFHSSDAPIVFDGLFLFHLAYVDYDAALRRQAKRRAQSFIDAQTAVHHTFPDQVVRDWMNVWSNMERDEGVALDAQCAAMADFQQRVLASQTGREGSEYRIDLDLREDRLWRVPARFKEVF